MGMWQLWLYVTLEFDHNDGINFWMVSPKEDVIDVNWRAKGHSYCLGIFWFWTNELSVCYLNVWVNIWIDTKDNVTLNGDLFQRRT